MSDYDDGGYDDSYNSEGYGPDDHDTSSGSEEVEFSSGSEIEEDPIQYDEPEIGAAGRVTWFTHTSTGEGGYGRARTEGEIISTEYYNYFVELYKNSDKANARRDALLGKVMRLEYPLLRNIELCHHADRFLVKYNNTLTLENLNDYANKNEWKSTVDKRKRSEKDNKDKYTLADLARYIRLFLNKGI